MNRARLAAGRRVDLERAAESGLRAGRTVLGIVRKDGRERIGSIEYERWREGGWLVIRDIRITSSLRGFGYGSEGARLLEESAVSRGEASRFAAPVGEGDGLSLYFWLRLGYRPAASNEIDNGEAFWMVRTPA